jgi:hypothetical protein
LERAGEIRDDEDAVRHSETSTQTRASSRSAGSASPGTMNP